MRGRDKLIVILLTLVALVPQAYVLFTMGRFVYLTGHSAFLYPIIPGISEANPSYSEFSHSIMWRGMFVRLVPDHDKLRSAHMTGMTVVNDFVLEVTDPQTGMIVGERHRMPSGIFRPVVLDDRLFLLGMPAGGNTVTDSYELIGDELKPVDFAWSNYDPIVLIEGKLFRIQTLPGTATLVVATVESGEWTAPQEIALPDFIRLTIPQVGFRQVQATNPMCLNHGKQVYTILSLPGKSYFYRGIPLRSIKDPNQVRTYGADESGRIADDYTESEWQLVQIKEKPISEIAYSGFAIVDGRLTALLVESIDELHSVGHLCQLDGDEWNELASIPFPKWAHFFRLLDAGPGSGPYLVATTLTGTAYVSQWESGEFREVAGQGPALTWKFLKHDIWIHLRHYSIILGLGLLPSLAIGLLTARLTSNRYVFGNKSTNLASLLHRGLARGLDLFLLAVIAAAVGLFMLRDVHWLDLGESLHRKLDHPDLLRINQTLYVEVVVLMLAFVSLALAQGICGATPGKWVCGLRTVRTTLRPCSIAQSLTRELLLVVDSTYLLWWVPGSLAIGLTERRQRIGDLVGDTIVVTAKSLKGEETMHHDN